MVGQLVYHLRSIYSFGPRVCVTTPLCNLLSFLPKSFQYVLNWSVTGQLPQRKKITPVVWCSKLGEACMTS